MRIQGKHMRSDRRFRRSWRRITALLSAGVVLAVIAALTLPAITMNGASCELQEHRHTALCYPEGTQRVLACAEAETPVHVHSDECWQLPHVHGPECFALEPVCGLTIEHGHDETCFPPVNCTYLHIHNESCPRRGIEAVTCQIPEGHVHETTCWKLIRGDKTCLLDEHIHADGCYEVLTSPVPTCGIEETAAHVHGELCWTLVKAETTSCTEDHEHLDTCYEQVEKLSCELPDTSSHTHDETCYGPIRGELLCAAEEHQHTDACFMMLPGDELLCQIQEKHVHEGNCRSITHYEYFCGREEVTELPTEPVLICPLEEVLLHEHGEGCLERVSAPDERYLAAMEAQFGMEYGAIDPELLPDSITILTCTLHVHGNGCYVFDGEPICPIPEHVHGVDCGVEAPAEPGTGTEVLPDGRVMLSNVGLDYTAQVICGAEAGLPVGTMLSVEELPADSDAYAFHAAQVLEIEGLGELIGVRFLDLTLMADGQPVQPAAPVTVRLRCEGMEPNAEAELWYVHFGPEGMEVLPVEYFAADDGSFGGVEVTQSSFSVGALVQGTYASDGMQVIDTTSSLERSTAWVDMADDLTHDDRMVSDAVNIHDWKNYYATNTTEFAGGVMTDKSVTTGAFTYGPSTGVTGGTITPAKDNFLVGLSAIASTHSVLGQESAPTDVMIVLDMSSSMYGGASRDVTTVSEMVNALNNTVKNLLENLNEHNRVGIVIYYGYSNVITQSDNTHGFVFMPLDRYTPGNDGTYLTVNATSGKLDGFSVSSGVRNSTGALYTKTHTIKHGHSGAEYTAGTYAQVGILNAMAEFLKADTTVHDAAGNEVLQLDSNGNYVPIPRRPVFVFMSDGEPTAASVDYTIAHTPTSDGGKRYGTMGDNVVKGRDAAETDFVTQLSAAYAKEQVTLHYAASTSEGNLPLYYTLGLKQSNGSLSMDVLNPSGTAIDNTIAPNYSTTADTTKINITQRIKGYWTSLLASNESTGISFTTKTYKHNSWTIETRTQTVKKTHLSDGSLFPSSLDQQFYVDRYYPAKDASDLKDAFDNIVLDISLQQSYIPTKAEANRLYNTGNISFIDTIGGYMTVTKVHGLVLDGVFHSGLELAKNFYEPGTADTPQGDNELGSFTNPTDLGIEFVLNVADELGIEVVLNNDPNFDESGGISYPLLKDNPAYMQAVELIQLAYKTGQLSYNSKNTPDTADDTFSNYIEWWAGPKPAGQDLVENRSEHNFLGFSHDKGVSCGEANCTHTTQPENAIYKIRTYFYLDPISQAEGTVSDSNMMYAMVWIRERVKDGNNGLTEGQDGYRHYLEVGTESVVFSLPAGLVPTVDYEVGLDMDGNVIRFETGGASCPAVLLYDVGLEPGVSAEEIIEHHSSYPGINRDAEDNVTYIDFWTNAWQDHKDENDEIDPNVYNTVNAYSYYRPSEENTRYYYTEDTPLLHPDGAPVTEAAQPYGSEFYFWIDWKYSRTYYSGVPDGDGTKGSIVTENVSISDNVLDHTIVDGKYIYQYLFIKDGCWYIKAGTPHGLTVLEGLSYATEKLHRDANGTATGEVGDHTDTFHYADFPYVTLHDPNTANPDNQFVIGAVLGNNGRLRVTPVEPTGTKSLAGYDLTKYQFNFDLYQTGSDFDTTKGTLVKTVQNVGETLTYPTIWPMYPGVSHYVIREQPHDYFICDQSQYRITVTVDEISGKMDVQVAVAKLTEDNEVVTVGQSINTINFTNLPGTRLPDTGGPGDLPYILSGTALMASCGVLWHIKRRKPREVANPE